MNEFLARYALWGFDQENMVDVKLPLVIRANTLKISHNLMRKELHDVTLRTTPHPLVKDALICTSTYNVTSSLPYLHGLFFVQDAASQLAAQALGVSENDVVLDACSAPGAKTTQLASIMHNKGMIVSVDSSFDRLQKVCFNLERCGVQNVIVIQKDMLYIQDLGRTFTKILLDVPCSGNFMIDANWFSKRTLSDIRIMSLQQKKLLEKTLKVLEVGGDLVYATCSLEREENEDVISYILQDPRYKLVETGLPGSPGLTEQTRVARRFWPSVHGTQGFFIAKITRVS